MKAHLLFADADFDVELPLPSHAEALREDLGLDTVFDVMAHGDPFLGDVAAVVTQIGLGDPAAITYRQDVLADCLAHPHVIGQLYDLTLAALADKKKVWAIMIKSPEGRLRYAVEILELMVARLRQLRRLADQHRNSFRSEGFGAFWQMVAAELADGYFDELSGHLATLRGFREGVAASAQLGPGFKATGFLVHRRQEPRLSWWQRLWYRPDGLTIVIAPADQGGNQALTELRNRSLNDVAGAVAQSADHVLSFFAVLRFELAFYLGCLHLHDRLTATAVPVCFPTPVTSEHPTLSARALSDLILALRAQGRVVANDLDAEGKALVVITGANQGGKSTFLRAIGIAYVLAQAGMFVPAESFEAVVRPGVFTHYKREEDATLTTGKLEEELSRMSEIVPDLEPGCLVLLNESFSSTNESEGAEIASSLIKALLESGVTVYCVTHSYELAERVRRAHGRTVLFLRAERRADGHRTFRILEDAPQATSHGEDLYRQIFGQPPKSWSPSSDGHPPKRRRPAPSDGQVVKRRTPGVQRG